jgi:hypothetical protein
MSDSPEKPAPEAELPDPPFDEDEPLTDGAGVPMKPGDGLGFGPVPVRYRHNGWTPDRQLEFIEALADGGCVEQAARAVGMSRNSAYALRRRPDAQAFRLAWDAATDNAVARLADAALSRAIHGVAVPVFHEGEQVGERRHYDERLTMFLLRYRAPERYGKWLDQMQTLQDPERPAMFLGYRILRMLRAAWTAFDAAFDGKEPPQPEPEDSMLGLPYGPGKTWH